jgi:hypothetical protein
MLLHKKSKRTEVVTKLNLSEKEDRLECKMAYLSGK